MAKPVWTRVAVGAWMFMVVGAAFLAVKFEPAAGAFLMAGAVVGPVIGFMLLRRTTGGVFPAWRDPLLDRDLPPIDAGSTEEWLAGRGALGGGAAGSAALPAAAVRAAWWEPEPSAALADLAWKVDPDPPEALLRRATRKGLRAARRALPGRGEVRVTGDLRRRPGPDLVRVRLVVRGQADAVKPWARAAEGAFARTFEKSVGTGFRLERTG